MAEPLLTFGTVRRQDRLERARGEPRWHLPW